MFENGTPKDNPESSENHTGEFQGSQHPSINLPKGGGAIRGIDQKFAVNPASGTASQSIPLPLSPSRGFTPSLALNYNSGAGNGPFGIGWDISYPRITRKSDKGLPRYLDAIESDVFILSDAEDLVPTMEQSGAAEEWQPKTVTTPHFHIQYYRPRIEGEFARIEKWTAHATGGVHWRSISRNNITTVYGSTSNSRIADPEHPERIFSWLICESRDDRGNAIVYTYKEENAQGVSDSLTHEANRSAQGRTANRYLKSVKYGNRNTVLNVEDLTSVEWLFEVVFDYGEHDHENPQPNDGGEWLCRHDPFSSYRSTFELRSYRLCQRILVFHHFKDEAELGENFLVRSLDLQYRDIRSSVDDKTKGHPAGSFLASVVRSGYRQQETGNKLKQSIPALEFEYSQSIIDDNLKTLDPESTENLPIGLDSLNYRWADLNGEGISGVLAEQENTWYFKENLGGGQFGKVQVVSPKPAQTRLNQSNQQLLDLAGNGQLDLVSFVEPMPGYFQRNHDESWDVFRVMNKRPNIAWDDPNVRFVDLSGDGLADILITEQDVFMWSASLQKDGFGELERVHRVLEKGEPRIVLNDENQSVFIADMSGDGMSDLVRVRNGEICYWPNLGYGHFGNKIVMDNCPLFDRPDTFDVSRIRLADIDGSGCSDLIYLKPTVIELYFNESGNSWTNATVLTQVPRIDNTSRIEIIDLFGNGTACLVWSSPLAANKTRPMRFIDLMSNTKPHLLVGFNNNMGAETKIEYVPSTQFYLDDKKNGKSWITKLPFPVHVVSQTESFDHINQNRFTSRYAYHHGYFDGDEREFRGFGMAEQWDSESFDDYSAAVVGHQDVSIGLFQPPVLTRTWYHTGAYIDHRHILHQLQSEYYQHSFLPEPSLPAAMDSVELKQCYRALKGLSIRQEIYSFDGTSEENHPYVVTETSYNINRVQPIQGRHAAVFLSHSAESISVNYERNINDPRISHNVQLEADQYGNTLKSCAIVYGRKIVDPALPLEVSRAQQALYVTYKEAEFTDDLIQEAPGAVNRLRIPYEKKEFEITGVAPAQELFGRQELIKQIAAATTIEYEQIGNGVAPQKRLLSHVVSYFLDNNLNPMPRRSWDTLGLVHQSYQLAFSPSLVSSSYGAEISDADFSAAGYVHLEGDDNWWIPSGQTLYPNNPEDRFYVSVGTKSPFGVETIATFDAYNLLVEQVRVVQADWNVVSAVNDYRTLGPVLLTDPNKNQTSVELDALGFVVRSAIMGKAGVGEGEGDSLDDPTSQLEYDLFNWQNNGRPNYARVLAKEIHGTENTRLQESFVYSDGSGGVAMTKTQAHPGKALQVAHDGVVLEVDADPRWIGNGRTILNNKGNPVKQYEPYFSTSHEFEDEGVLREIGVSPVIYYDAIGRTVRTEYADGTLSRIEFTPWLQRVFDQNDTIRDSDWFNARGSPDSMGPEPADAESRAAWLAVKHADTPDVVHFDSLGRLLFAVSDYGGGKTAAVRSENDFSGRYAKLFDQLGREVSSGFTGMAGTPITSESAEKPKRWTFLDIFGAQIKSWDEHGRHSRTEYDELRRPLNTFVQEAGQGEILVSHMVYGDRNPNAEQFNLLGAAHFTFDQAGMVRVLELDFKGSPVRADRLLAIDYENPLDWSSVAAQSDYAMIQATANTSLESDEAFSTESHFDALSRPTRVRLPDDTVIKPLYNESNYLISLQAQIRGQGEFIEFLKDQDYDAKGQRQFAHFGNDVIRAYFYDPATFRLSNLLTYRSGANADTQSLQDLHYHYDPVGNVTQIQDNSQQTHYFNNAVVNPVSRYEYDALYQLTRATGREHAGTANNSIRDHNDLDFVAELPHNNNVGAVRNYAQEYDYDLLGNISSLRHRHKGQAGAGGGWTRHYRYAYKDDSSNTSNQLSSTSLAGDPDSGPYSAHYSHDLYGNMTQMPHLASMSWNSFDQLNKVDLGGGGKAFYVYGTGGERIRKVIHRSATLKNEWIYLGAVTIYRRRSRDTNAIDFERSTVRITDNTGPIAQVDSKTIDASNSDSANPLHVPLIRYQFDNHLGSATIETNEVGLIISYEEFHPFGTSAYRYAKPGFDLSLKRYRYSGKERDNETGLYYYGYRYYAAWLGRWTSSDPLGFVNGANLFEFCANNPIVFKDPNGADFEPTDTFTGNEGVSDLQAFARSRHLVIDDPNFTEANMGAGSEFYEANPNNEDGSGGRWNFDFRRMTPQEITDYEASQNQPEPSLSPANPEPAPSETEDTGSNTTMNRVIGGIQLVGGLLEGALAIGLLLTPEPTMVTKVAGGVMAVHSLDTIVAGARTLWTGEVAKTLTHQAGAGVARAAGASDSTAEWVGTGTDVVASIGPALGVGISRRLAVGGAEFVAAGSRSSTVEVLEGAGVAVQQYKPTGQVIAQMTADTCVSGSCRMIASDVGVMLTEETVATALNTTARGANMLEAAKVLDNLGVSGGEAIGQATLTQLEIGLASGRSAMVGLRLPGYGSHAVVVDKIADGMVFLRDPLPVAQGSAFAMPIRDFIGIWSNRLVTF